MEIIILMVAWSAFVLMTCILVLSHKNRLDSHRLRRYAGWIYEKPWRVLVIGELDITLFSWWMLLLYQTEPFASAVGSPIYHALSMFIILSLILLVYIIRTFGVNPPVRGALKSTEELYEAEALSWEDLTSGLNYIITYINENESNPNEVLRSTLSHISLRNDGLGELAKERLKELE